MSRNKNKSKPKANNLSLDQNPFLFTDKQLSILDTIDNPRIHLTLFGYAGTAKTVGLLIISCENIYKEKTNDTIN